MRISPSTVLAALVACCLLTACVVLPTAAPSGASANPGATTAAAKPGTASAASESGSVANASPTSPATPPSGPSAASAAFAAAMAGASAGEPKKYESVITKDAKTSRGMLLYHKVKERHYFEIPEKLLGRDLFWSAEVAQSSGDIAFNGLPLGAKVLRFERVDSRILLRAVSFRKRGTDDLKAAMDAVDLAPIVMSFNIETEGSERSLDLRADEKKALEEKDKKKTDKNEPDNKLAADKKEAEKSTENIKEKVEAARARITEAIAKATTAKEADASANAKKDDKSATKEKWPVIDVARLLLTTSSDLIDARFAGPQGFGAPDPTRSIINQVKVFKENVGFRSTMTFSSSPFPSFAPGSAPSMPTLQVNPSRTAVLHFNLALLPEKPMQGRYADPRVGFFTERFQEYGGARSGVRGREFITRFRLEKTDPAAELSDVIRPITFYIAPEVPAKWRAAIKQGIEAWKPAFEKAGFKNAIQARDPPTKQEDPDWDPEDARHSVIRWVAQPVANAMGPSVHDPRSGEVISAHIVFWHDILRFAEQLYFIQAGAADPRVGSLPISDELMSELLREVATHEVGHTLGLRHNHRASTAYSVKQLRDAAFTKTNGISASVMSYARYNSIAQPGDGVTDFTPRLGPYDFHAIEWGYKPFGKNVEEETVELDRMAARALENPHLAFGGEDMLAFFDPEVLTENIGKERIAATRLSVSSLEKAAARLIPATTKLGEDYTVLQQTYNMLNFQRYDYLSSVTKLIGGVRETRYLGGRGGDTFTRATVAEQRAAIRFMLDEALVTPKWLVKPELLNRIRVFQVSGSVVNAQKSLLEDMLFPVRFRLLEDAEMIKPGSGMTAAKYLETVQAGVFRELASTKPSIDIYRRELQRAYIDQLKAFTGDLQRFTNFSQFFASSLSSLSIDLRAASVDALRRLQRDARNTAPRAADQSTRLHLTQLDREIEQILKIRGS